MKPTKTVIITGTSRGIGFELVHLFANAGYEVLALSRNAKPVSNLNFENITALSFDLSKSEDYDRVEAFVKKEWKQVDILINNAGTLLNKPFADTTFEDFQQVYNTNVFGVAELTRRTIPFMPSKGHVVTISSMGGVHDLDPITLIHRSPSYVSLLDGEATYDPGLMSKSFCLVVDLLLEHPKNK